MAVFYDTGGGDIYAGPTREACVEAMRADMGDDFDEELIEEVPGDSKMSVTNENDEPTGELITLNDEYDESQHAYCICSDNL